MNTPHSTPEDGLSEDELLTTLRAAAPNVPAGLSERVLAGVRAGALARLRFRDELERSARGVLLAAAACLALCGALFLGQGGAGAPATADGRPSRAGSGSLAPRNSPAERSDPRWDASQGPTQGSPTQGSTVSIDDSEALSLTSTQGVLEGELTAGLWLFNSGEGE